MKQSQLIITGLLILMVVASLCIGSTTPTTSSTTSSQTGSTASSHTYSSTSTSSTTTTSSACQSCEIGHNGTQNGTSQGATGNQTNTSTNTPGAGNGGNGGNNGTSSNSSVSTGNTSTNSNNSSMAQNGTSQNSTQNTTMTQLPHPFPAYKLPINKSLIKFYIYGSHECCRCRRLLQFLSETYGNDSIVFYEISNGTNNTIVSKGFLVDYPEMGYLPITGIAYNGTLVAIVSGYNLPYDVEGLIKIALQYRVLVIKDPSGKIHYVGSAEKRAALEEVFLYNRLPSGS